MLSDSSVLYLLLGSTLVRTISHVFTKQNGASVLRKTFCSLQAPALDIRHSPVSPYVFLHLSLSLITVARVHSKSQPYSSNQCDTARLESKLTRRLKMMFVSSHETEHSFSNEAQRLVYRRLRRRTKRRLRDTRSVADSHLVHSSALISSSLLPLLSQLSKIIILVPLTFFLARTVNYAQR